MEPGHPSSRMRGPAARRRTPAAAAVALRPAAIALAAAALCVACMDMGSLPADPNDGCNNGKAAGNVSLAAGEAMKLASGNSLCLTLPGSPADQYALAFVDTRAIDAARGAAEPMANDPFVLTIGSSGNQRGTRAVVPAAPAAVSDLREWTRLASAGDAGNRASLWKVGETFQLNDALMGGVRQATVKRVYDGWLVVAAFTEPPDPRVEGMVANLDLAWPIVRDRGIPLLKKLLSDSLPVTSGATAQLLVMIRGDLGNAAGVSIGGTDATRTLSQIALLPYSSPADAPFVASLLMHEVTHAFQRQYISETRTAGTPPSVHAGASLWAVEGGAWLMQVELARRLAGIPWAANWEFRSAANTDQAFYARFAASGGAFMWGYAPPAGFLRNLAERRVRAGEGVDEALAAVMRGSLEGWFGHDALRNTRTGLAARMRASLGAAWEPGDAMLAWTLSHAADDRTPSLVYQDHGFMRAWDSAEASAWRAFASLSPGAPPVRLAQYQASTGYFEMAGGGSYSLSSTVDGVQWMVVRLR